ncbi:hypothetical protein HY572_01100 [Candidatus Micrarchaeota archaeon]|nr:hypothetical protein [Candidatus Micrarchaeota archaeon]
MTEKPGGLEPRKGRKKKEEAEPEKELDIDALLPSVGRMRKQLGELSLKPKEDQTPSPDYMRFQSSALDPEVKQALIETIQKMKIPDDVTALHEGLHRGDEDIRQAVIRRCSDLEDIGRLQRVVEDGHAMKAPAAITLLRHMGIASISALASAMKLRAQRGDGNLTKQTAQALHELRAEVEKVPVSQYPQNYHVFVLRAASPLDEPELFRELAEYARMEHPNHMQQPTKFWQKVKTKAVQIRMRIE